MSSLRTRIVFVDGFATNPGDLSWTALEALGDFTAYDRSAASEVIARLDGVQAVITNKVPLPREVQAALPHLKYIGVAATGYNIVDVVAAREFGITVTNIPSYGTHSVAQHTIALLLELTNRVGAHAADTRAGGWARNPDWSYSLAPSIELAGKTLGIVGFGRIGQQTARIAHALGMNIAAYDHRPESKRVDDFPVTWLTLDGLLETADVVSLHCPLVDSTRGLINAASLKRMKRSALLLNASRGPLVVETDLAEALELGVIAGAGLDVLSQEPPVDGSPLLSARNCVVTPHNAWASTEARSRLIRMLAENLAAWLAGSPRNVVS